MTNVIFLLMNRINFQKDVLFHGRVKIEEDSSVALDWAFSGFTFRFEGTKIQISIKTNLPDKWSLCIAVDYDGALNDMIELTTNSYLYEKVFDFGVHTVTFRKMTKPWQGLPLNVDFVDIEGKVLEKPEARRRKLEFIGDSITVGYGVTCAGDRPDGYKPIYQDVRRAYPYIIGERFNAEIQTNAWAGVGLYCNHFGEIVHQVMEWYPRLLPWRGDEMNDFSKWVPDAIVIGEGTNDCKGKAPPEEFKKKLIELLEFVRSKYHSQPIIWVYGMMNNGYQSYIQEAIESFKNSRNDKNVYTIFFDQITGDEIGGNEHPNEKAHIKYANIIGDKIAELLKW